MEITKGYFKTPAGIFYLSNRQKKKSKQIIYGILDSFNYNEQKKNIILNQKFKLSEENLDSKNKIKSKRRGSELESDDSKNNEEYYSNTKSPKSPKSQRVKIARNLKNFEEVENSTSKNFKNQESSDILMDFFWKIRLIGGIGVGKTTIVEKLSEIDLDLTKKKKTYPSYGLTSKIIRIPIKLKDKKKPKDVFINFEEVGSFIENKNEYLKFEPSSDLFSISREERKRLFKDQMIYDRSILVFSMIDKNSFKLVNDLLEKKIYYNCFVVGIKIDLIENYEVFEKDIKSMNEQHEVSILLCNCFQDIFSDNGLYQIIEEIFETIN